MATPSSPAPVSADPKSQARSSTELTTTQWDLVLANQGLIRFVIGRWFRRPDVDFDDMAQDGLFGLMRAAQKHDPTRGRYSTYAIPWIRQSIERGIWTLEGIGYRQGYFGTAEWHRPASLDAPVHLDGDAQTLGDLLTDHDRYVDPADDHAVAAAELAWANVRNDYDIAILEALEDGRGAVSVAAEFDYTRSSAAKRVERLRTRIARQVAELQGAGR